MRRALRRAGWALAAAGGIGIAAPALAQSSPVQVIGPDGQVMSAENVTAITESRARQEEAQVELALLADPMLFSYGLGAHVQGAALEVRGYVPTAAVREQALKVAREATALPVADKTQIHTHLATHGTVDKPENIQRAAKELLEDAFPERGKGMDVRCDARGRVTVTGSADSLEEMVMVSRKLRQVPGCSCVVNQLGLPAAQHEVRHDETAHSTVLTDVPHPRLAPTHAPLSATPKESNPPALGMPRVHVPPPPELKPLPAPAPRHLPPLPPVDVAPPPIKAPSKAPSLDFSTTGETKPAPAVRPAEVVTRPVTPALPPLPEIRPAPPVKLPEVATPPTKPLPLLPPVGDARPAPAVKAPVPVTWPPAPVVPPPPLPVVETKPAPAAKLPEVVTKSVAPAPPPVVVTRPAPAVRLPEVVTKPAALPLPLPLPPVPPLSSQPVGRDTKPLPPAKAPAGKKHDVGGGEESYVTEGTITFGDDPPPAKPVTPKPMTQLPPKPASEWTKSLTPPRPASEWTKSPTASPVKPAEGTLVLAPPSKPAGPVTLSAPPAKAPTPPAPVAPPRPPLPPALRLKERIEAACGPGYEVKVTARGKNGLQVVVPARSAADGQRLMNRITTVLGSKDFAAMDIDVDVTVPGK